MVDTNSGISLCGIALSIGDFSLRNINLSVTRGEYFVLTGPNGSGKSMLLKLICGLHPASEGTVSVGGTDITTSPPWLRNVGYVPQDGTLFPHRTVWGNISFGLEVRKYPKAQRTEIVREMLHRVGIEHLAQRTVHGLSGGERQKVALARALVFKPSVLLLDEPVSAIDEKTRDVLCADLRSIQQSLKVTTIHVSHNSHETRLVADRVVYLSQGTISEGAS